MAYLEQESVGDSNDHGCTVPPWGCRVAKSSRGDRPSQRAQSRPRSRRQNAVDLGHRGLHALFHAHAEQPLERLKRGERRHRHHARATVVRLEGETHPHRRHVRRLLAVRPEEAVLHLERPRLVDAQELPEAA